MAKYLPEADIRVFEDMEAAALRAALDELGPQKTAERFALLLISYRMAATVANAAFRFMKERTAAAAEQLESALVRYAPAHFIPPANDLELRLDILVDVYEQLEPFGDPAVLEHIYASIVKYQQVLEGRRAEAPSQGLFLESV